MNDFEKFKELYQSIGVDFKTANSPDEIQLRGELGGGHYSILLKSGTNRVSGYPEFVTELIFDKDGRFIEQVIAE